MFKQSTYTRIPDRPLASSTTKRRGGNLIVLIVAVATVLVCLTRTSSSSSLRLGTSTSVHLDVSGSQDTFFCDAATQASGYIKLPHKVDDHYFYWFFESRDRPATDPLVLWLSGGPGASSLLALLTSNGPCFVGADGNSTTPNPHSWTNHANVLWVDEPTGTGFSYGAPTDYDQTQEEIGANMYAFLERWLDQFPAYMGRPLFITGESYAGEYIPVIASTILDRQASANNHTTGIVPINLQGIALGNAVVSEIVQATHRADLIVNNAYNLTLMNDDDARQYQANASLIATLTEQCDRKGNATACHLSGALFRQSLFEPLVTIAHVSPYDMREPATLMPDGRVPADLLVTPTTERVVAFLNQPHVRARLNVSTASKPWTITSSDVGRRLAISDVGQDEPRIASLLHRGVRVLVYAGDADLICNWRGCEAWTLHMRWAGQNAYANATEETFLWQGQPAGAGRSAHNLTFLRVFHAGHMVPANQPQVALAMLERFMHKQVSFWADGSS
ncbi:Aste57867_11520 [Aphanomyces stellatus]|uniref:Carboxypeptidase n=1 Tax=Aphanomyces stellatus TaxID=120398 RepID=A0A485KT77_9STRA|nr:hypothetical protein As57867_011477 [Aphanomyces stellatus]VFT88381.1 Aste57867_11520 [Aphanomyces stellatus]